MSIEKQANLEKAGFIATIRGKKSLYFCKQNANVLAIEFDYYYLFVHRNWLNEFLKNPEHRFEVFLSAYGQPNGKTITINLSCQTIYSYTRHKTSLSGESIAGYLNGEYKPFAITSGKFPLNSPLAGVSDYTLKKYEYTHEYFQELILELGKGSSHQGVMIVRNRSMGNGSLSGAMDVLLKEHEFNVYSWHLLFCFNNKTTDHTYVKQGHNNYNNTTMVNTDLITDNNIYREKLIKNYIMNTSLFGKSDEAVSQFVDLLQDHTIEFKDLKHIKDLGVSAHAVGMYKNPAENDKLYFVKRFNIHDSPKYDEAIADAIAEIIYCKIWRYFIGNRASKSVLVINNNRIEGIASEGLNKFKEFGEIDLNDRFKYPGLATILFYSHILCEEDLHIYNYGVSEQYSTNQGKNIPVYCKIDHDYIISHLNKLTEFIKKPLDPRIYCFTDINQRISLFKELISSMRFTPGKADLKLVFGHSIRQLYNSNAKVTATTNDIQQAFEEAISLNRHFQEEINICFNNFTYKIKNQKVGEYFNSLKNLLNNFNDLQSISIQRRHIDKSFKLLNLLTQRFQCNTMELLRIPQK
ncbi:hypothetical protein [Allofrancisella frigidaquae]|uniref:Uncharacterized protein n=1 Tax=Allofrancisella frigidaquae TaxID=1085644 RepID=A0A6M3HWQ7_9GAMM|nr:hypothetical protein [Allofrancisella frigidaquae]QIV94481.1 hypothetical protein E3E15_03535 [Allofrancisella frigidaquae]